MTLQEFKAWFEGYTEAIETAPTKAQFARIKEQVAKIDGSPVTRTVYEHIYREYPWWKHMYAAGKAEAAY